MRYAIAGLLLFLSAINTAAQPGIKPLGAGISLGQPTGLSARYFLGSAASVQGILGWRGGDDGAIFVQGDYLLHAPRLGDVDFATVEAFYGGGASLLLADNPGLGVHVTGGISLWLKELPMEITLHLSPGLALLPDTDFRVGSGISARWYF